MAYKKIIVYNRNSVISTLLAISKGIMKYFISLLCALFSMMHLTATPTYTIRHINDQECEITIEFNVSPKTVIYNDYLNLSVDHPGVQLTSWHTDCEPVMQYDESFKENKRVFSKNFSITAHAKTNDASFPTSAQLHCAYYTSEQKKVCEDLFPLALPVAQSPASETLVMTKPSVQTLADTTAMPQEKTVSFAERISSLVQTTDSLGMRLLLVLLLGILMSLTPCIYPMIPITVGILQGQAKQSFIHNFFIALSYTFGIATTFALLGLTAAYTGQLFGTIMNNPFVILGIVALLIYLALCMFDVVQMRTPRALSGGALGSMKGGSFLSAFLFGAASGTVASPCLSPGLIMLLSLVTSLGNPYLGFVLLFFFGIGLSIPLLLIGTFSSSLSMLPQAGMWMIEIKHFFGLLLLSMCIYFLKTLLPAAVIAWLIVALSMGSGLYYLYSARTTFSPTIRMIKNLLGIALLALSVHLFFKAYQSVTEPIVHESSSWEKHYETALDRAKKENKKLFINIGAPFCSICHALDDTLFKNEQVLESLNKCVMLKVDGSQANHPVCCNKAYNVIGFPTILVVDPATCCVIKRWGAELYDTKKEAFIEDIEACILGQ